MGKITNESKSRSKTMMNRSKLYEWLLEKECPFDWDVDEKSSTDKTVNLIFSEEDDYLD